MLRNNPLSDDLGFRISDPAWPRYTLTPEKIARWLAQNGARQVADFDGDRVFALR